MDEKEKIELSEEQIAQLEKAMEEANMPIKMDNKDFQMGARELDIRGLNKANKDQVFFRLLANTLTYTRACQQNMVDIMKLIMLILKKLGIESIIDATDKLEDELKAEVESKTEPKK